MFRFGSSVEYGVPSVPKIIACFYGIELRWRILNACQKAIGERNNVLRRIFFAVKY